MMLLASTTSCKNSLEPEQPGNRRQSEAKEIKMYTVGLALGGDYVSEYDEPLVRAGEGNTYVGINVTRTEIGKTEEAERYAYGVYNRLSDIKIDLFSGYTYDFEATILVDANDKLETSNGYDAPFRKKEPRDNQATNYDKSSINQFQYTHDITDVNRRPNLIEINRGRARVEIFQPTGNAFGYCAYPRVKRYYGSYERFNPSNLSTATVNLDMKFKCFGLKMEALNIPEGTTVTWRDVTPGSGKDALAYLQFPEGVNISGDSNGSKMWEDIYSLSDMTGTSPEQFTIEFTWHKGLGKTETFEQKISVSPKTKKTLKISVNGEASTKTDGNINLIVENDELVNDDITVSHTSQGN